MSYLTVLNTVQWYRIRPIITDYDYRWESRNEAPTTIGGGDVVELKGQLSWTRQVARIVILKCIRHSIINSYNKPSCFMCANTWLFHAWAKSTAGLNITTLIRFIARFFTKSFWEYMLVKASLVSDLEKIRHGTAPQMFGNNRCRVLRAQRSLLNWRLRPGAPAFIVSNGRLRMRARWPDCPLESMLSFWSSCRSLRSVVAGSLAYWHGNVTAKQDNFNRKDLFIWEAP